MQRSLSVGAAVVRWRCRSSEGSDRDSKRESEGDTESKESGLKYIAIRLASVLNWEAQRVNLSRCDEPGHRMQKKRHPQKRFRTGPDRSAERDISSWFARLQGEMWLANKIKNQDEKRRGRGGGAHLRPYQPPRLIMSGGISSPHPPHHPSHHPRPSLS